MYLFLKKDNIPLILVLLTVIIAVLFSFLLYLSIGYTTYLDTKNLAFANVSKDFTFNVDSVKLFERKQHLTINGYIFKQGKNISKVFSYFVLYDEQEGNYLLLPSKMVVREDVEKKLTTTKKEKIKNCGISSKVNINKINRNHTYKIYVLYQNDDNNVLVYMHKRINGLGEVIK